MTHGNAIALVAGPCLFSIMIGTWLLRRALARRRVLPEELALAVAWVFIVGSLVWLEAYLAGASLLGFDAPWTWLAASHFAFAGFGALTVTALSCRMVSDSRALRILRLLLLAHPVAYLVTAAGISGYPYCDELGASAYGLIFTTQAAAVIRGRPDRIAPGPRRLVILALIVPLATMVPALAWAWGRPLFDLDGMVRYHGLVNAVGHVGLGLIAFAWGRPPAHVDFDGSFKDSDEPTPLEGHVHS